MAKTTKVKLNQPQWGNQVMSGDGVKQLLAATGARVAARIPGSSVQVTNSRTVRGGGRRARAIVTTPVTLQEEAANGTALAALSSVVPGAQKIIYHTTRKGNTRRATAAQVANWTRKRGG